MKLILERTPRVGWALCRCRRDPLPSHSGTGLSGGSRTRTFSTDPAVRTEGRRASGGARRVNWRLTANRRPSASSLDQIAGGRVGRDNRSLGIPRRRHPVPPTHPPRDGLRPSCCHPWSGTSMGADTRPRVPRPPAVAVGGSHGDISARRRRIWSPRRRTPMDSVPIAAITG